MITTLARPKTIRIAGFAGGAAAIAAAAVYITASAAGVNFGFGSHGTAGASSAAASTVSDKASASGVCNEFASHFSSDLGVSQDKVNAAFQKAVGQTLADEVKAGDITQAQADAIQKRMAGKAPCAIAGSLSAPKGTAGAGAYTQALMTAAASALGISPEQLKADLAKGMTLHQIASAQNPPVTEDQFRSRLIANLTPLLDKAVADKKITPAQEQKFIQALQSGPIPFWDTPMRKPSAAASPGA